jgi:hypothetical protein
MRTLNALLLTTALVAPLAAEDFRPLAGVVQTTWSPSRNLAVACNYANSKAAVSRLAEAFDGAYHITVVDIHHPAHLGRAKSALIALHPDLMVLLPEDNLVRDGSYEATVLISALYQAGIPSAGTRAIALKQGALFAIGEGTSGELMVNQHRVGTIGPIKGEVSRNGAHRGATGFREPREVRVVALK